MRLFVSAIMICVALPTGVFAADTVTRRDGFLLIWQSISRPAEKTSEKPYIDVQQSDTGYLEITYAKSRGILNDTNERFRPMESLTPSDALLLLFRTRSVERLKENGDIDFMKLPDAPDLSALAEKYGMEENVEAPTMSREQLLSLMRDLDLKLAAEQHEASLYSEKFHGKGTAFGESFDMNAPTAAHRTFPVNTLVRVTNLANKKSVIVRINDRGPFVQGRDLDLSLGAFTTIAERSVGKIQTTFERLGDVDRVRRCKDDRFQKRITKDVRLQLGIPHSFALGATLQLRSDQPFVMRDIVYPDGGNVGTQTWVTKDETYQFTPSILGLYRFFVGTKIGRMREMTMEVVECS